jgi:hypothetical protein
MNQHTRKFIFILSFFLITTCSFAQNVFIANDFVACAVGLKDSSGKWIVEPIYQDIERLSDTYYEVLYGSKEGIIDSSGKIVVPPIYDYVSMDWVRIDSSVHAFFTVTEKGVSGLVNSKHQFIIPVKCRRIDVGHDGSIVAETTKKRYSLYTIDGKETVIPKKQGTEPLMLGDRMYVVSRNSFGVTVVQRYFPKSKKSWRRYRSRLTLRKKYGVMNDSLRMIIPKKFSEVYYGPGKYKLVTVEKRKKTGYYNTAGKEIWAPVYKINYSFKRRNYIDGMNQTMINSFGFTAASYNKKYGIIGVNGDTILPFIYTSIYAPYSNNNATYWPIDLDGKDGIYNPQERVWILEPIYQSLMLMATFRMPDDTQSLSPVQQTRYYYSAQNQEGYKLLLARKNGKYGVITSDGDEILPFVYDDYNSKHGGYCLRKDSSYFMVVVPTYTAPGARYSYLNRHNVVGKAPADLKFKKVELQNGVTLFINPDLVKDSAQLALYNIKMDKHVVNPNTYGNLLHATALTVTPLVPTKVLPGIGPVYTYHSPNLNYMPFDSADDFTVRQNKYAFYLYEVRADASDDFHKYYSVGSYSGLYREDGFRVLRPFSYDYYSMRGKTNGLAYFSVDCGKNKTGLIDGNGKLLVDTTWGVIGQSKGNYLWVKKKYHPMRYREYKWNILDTTKNELLLHRKLRSGSQSGFGAHAVIIERPEGEKLYNLDTRTYILNGNVRGIFQLDSAGNYFAVRTCYGNIGIIDGYGRWLTDTIWKKVINANNREVSSEGNDNMYYFYERAYVYSSAYDYSEKAPYYYCVLSNDTGWIIFDGFKGTVSRDAQTADYLLDLAFNSFDMDSITGMNKFCEQCPSYSFADTTKNVKLAPWQETVLFDSLFTIRFIADTLHYWNDYGCSDCRKRNPKQYFQYAWSANYDREALHHYIDFQNESCISVSRSNLDGYGYGYGSSDPKDLFFTVMLFSDGPHTMLLDSLFTGLEWKTFISTETNLYFESHPNIEGNCHNPYMLPMVMKDRFVLTPKGIELYPPNYKENGTQLHVPISWEKLKPYLRKDVAEKLGLKL